MNSMSRYYYKDDCNPCKEDFDPCKHHYDPYVSKKVCDTIIKCGCPSSTTIPTTTAASGTKFTITSLTLDTCHLKHPCIKLEFASNVIADATFVGTLGIQVFKQCNNQITPTPIGPVWSLSIPALTSETFSFFVCDCDCTCFNGCCTYTVIANATVDVTGTLAINNATLGAIVTSGVNPFC
ncbi:DUF4489 domain-containing protein [Clostridium sp. 001]|uniref:DUF4489 domain-containing protein n=1 Tax=Clostridium sp. 001 TaxID=1970093 RepID=UPI001C2BEBDD|nr:DUF4489 domain-containing protein [Clostridium sp. 001]QXE20979.1 hypothetical protein B5S50_20185 [Clostridium sp. 001]